MYIKWTFRFWIFITINWCSHLRIKIVLLDATVNDLLMSWKNILFKYKRWANQCKVNELGHVYKSKADHHVQIINRCSISAGCKLPQIPGKSVKTVWYAGQSLHTRRHSVLPAGSGTHVHCCTPAWAREISPGTAHRQAYGLVHGHSRTCATSDVLKTTLTTNVPSDSVSCMILMRLCIFRQVTFRD